MAQEKETEVKNSKKFNLKDSLSSRFSKKKQKEEKEKQKKNEENIQRTILLNALANQNKKSEEKKEEKEEKKNQKPKEPKMDKSYTNKLKRAQNNYQAATWVSKAICIPLVPVAIALAFNPLTAIASIILLGISMMLMCAGIFIFPELKDACEETQGKYETDVLAPKYAEDYKKYVKECYERGYEPEGNNNTFTQGVDYDYEIINQSAQNAAQAAQQQQQDAQPQK